MIIGVTGTYGAGKDAVAEYLISKGFNHYSLSDELRAILRELNIEESREALIKIGNELREKHGPGHVAERVAKKLKRPAVVTSIRNPKEVDTLRENEGFVMVHIDADRKIRYGRTVLRARTGDTMTFEEFVEKEEKELSGGANEQNLAACFAKADHVIMNEAKIEDLHKEIEKLLENIGA